MQFQVLLFIITMSNLFPPSTSFTTPRPAEETIDRLSKWKKRWHDNMIGKNEK